MTERPENEIAIDQDEIVPIPPRFWWLKRILVLCGALLILLVGVRVWWGREADRRLQAEIDRIIAAGEPIYPADFDPPPMRTEENAAKFYLDAEAALNLSSAQSDLVHRLVGEYAEIRRRLDEVEPLVLANAKVFHLVHQGGALKKFDWGNRLRTPAIKVMLPSLSMHRYLSRTLSIVATYYAERGHETEATTTLLDELRFCKATDREPFVIGHLVAIACRALVVHDIEHIVPTLTLTSPTRPRDANSTTAPRESVSLLITELLDDRGFRTAHILAMQADRMMLFDTMQMVIRGDEGIDALSTWGPIAAPPWWERALTLPLTPMLEFDALAGIRSGSALVDAARQPNWPAAHAAFPPSCANWSPLERMIRPVSGIMFSPAGRPVFQHYLTLAETRMAAIALAIRLYKVDHGRRPASLSELVPEYLSAVPIDPLAADTRPIGYLPNAPKPILYSVGQNGTDDGGRYTSAPTGGVGRKSLDWPFFLDGDRPARRHASDNNRDGSKDGHNDDDEVQGDRGNAKKDQPAQ